jgi:enolase-phosphatase E1
MILTLLAAIVPVLAPVDAIVTDIEGTTTSISFVHDTLFPYAKQTVGEYVLAHSEEPRVQKILLEVQEIANVSAEEVVPTLLSWMEQDKKISPLKTLQGLMWEEGYRRGDFQGHVYEDAYEMLSKWHDQGMPLYVYSSGSVLAQKLLFSHSTKGDMTPLFLDYFDTKVGGKKERDSYLAIANQIGVSPDRILFLTDSTDEVKAAVEAGMQTVLISRDGALDGATTFYEIGL